MITPTTSGSAGISADASDEEESEESSSSNIEQTLADFRDKWQKEIKSSRNAVENKSETLETDQTNCESQEDKAKVLFMKGVEMERTGKLYEAIQFYKRAVQIVPDIEFRLHESKIKSEANQKPENKQLEEKNDLDQDLLNLYINEEKSDDEDTKNLLQKIQKSFNNSTCICRAAYDQKAFHISSLPTELVLYILRWVVSSELDLRSLEMCSMVCRGFYLCARDSEIWRLACVRTWGVNCGALPLGYDSWRDMYVERARVHFNGCYISKTTYIRQGENSFQDQFYRPWHFVAYYRYLRFFPEGLALMLTTAEEPTSCVSLLKNRTIQSPAVLSGHYRLKDNRVTLYFQRQDTSGSKATKRNRKRDNVQENSVQTFHMELEIRNVGKKRNVQLVWIGYSVTTKTRKGVETTCTFDLVTNRFPPLWFSRVKSYTTESEAILQ